MGRLFQMNKYKSYIIYAVLVLLIIVSFQGIIFKRINNSSFIALMSMPLKEQSHIPENVNDIMKKAATKPNKNPVVGIGIGQDYAETTMAAVENIGGIKELIKKGDVVLIKPNICTVSKPGSPITTDYRVVKKILEMVREYGAKKVIVAEGSINGNAFDDASLIENKYDTLEGVELFNFNNIVKKDCYILKPDNSMTEKAFFIPKIYMDADIVINIAKLKTHSQAVVSLSLKNVFGVPSKKIYGDNEFKERLHILGMNESIIDLNLIRKPDLALIEGIVGGEGEGPINNTKVQSNIIFAGKDLVALDTVALNFMGFKVNQVPHVKIAAEKKMGISDINLIKIVGAEIDSIKMDFRSEFKQ